MDLRPLALLIPDLKRFLIETGQGCARLSQLKYRRLAEAALDGEIPAERVNARWHYDPRNVPAIAEALGVGSSRPAGRRSAPGAKPSQQVAA